MSCKLLQNDQPSSKHSLLSSVAGFLTIMVRFVHLAVTSQTVIPESSDGPKSVSMEELMNLKFPAASKLPQKLASFLSVVQVVTGEQIRNSGTNSIAGALRMVSNLPGAQMCSNAWIISSPGFDTVFAEVLSKEGYSNVGSRQVATMHYLKQGSGL